MKPGEYQDLFAKPTVGKLRKTEGFANFVGYVFARAGYRVEPAPSGSGATFQLFAQEGANTPEALVVVRKYAEGNNIGVPVVLQLQGLIGPSITRGYIVTTSDFIADARRQALNTPQVTLLDCRLLKRYIDYIRCSRDEHAKTARISPDAIARADGIPRRDPGRTRILAIANNKGGEGKTTTALYLAKRLGEGGRRVLLVDVDAQANLSRSLPDEVSAGPQAASLVEYFTGRTNLADLVRSTQLTNVWLIPSDSRLRLVTTGAATDPDTELRFLEGLHDPSVRPPKTEPESAEFDWIIVDTPPDMSFLTRCALAGSRYVVAPTSPGPFAESGLQQLFDTMDAMRALAGGDIRLMGCLITKWQDNAHNNDALNLLKQYSLLQKGAMVFDTKIPYDPNIVTDERERFHIPGLSKKPGAVKYGEFVQEVVTYDSNA